MKQLLLLFIFSCSLSTTHGAQISKTVSTSPKAIEYQLRGDIWGHPVDEKGWHPITLRDAITWRVFDMIPLLIDKKNINHRIPPFNETPLCLAIQYNLIDIIRLFVAAGAEPDLIIHPDEYIPQFSIFLKSTKAIDFADRANRPFIQKAIDEGLHERALFPQRKAAAQQQIEKQKQFIPVIASIISDYAYTFPHDLPLQKIAHKKKKPVQKRAAMQKKLRLQRQLLPMHTINIVFNGNMQ